MDRACPNPTGGSRSEKGAFATGVPRGVTARTRFYRQQDRVRRDMSGSHRARALLPAANP